MNYKIKYNNSLSHHGVLGMKWGVWNDETTARYRGGKTLNKTYEERTFLKSNKDVSIEQIKRNKISRLLAKSKKIMEDQMDTKMFDLKINDENIGDLTLFQESEDSLNVVWIGIDDEYRGHGYATSVMNEVQKFAKSRGYKQITLEVPGNSPDARHIYEKQGFKEVGQLTSADDDFVWEGLTKMRKKL